ncbi:hypothetical protein RclHR1_00520040 [Rhizophagus clarus]|uniref:Uncharacterized protein n=1 Tax=Rhizophagus clarus TaxID=94130 RepID=A0A2Z6RKZ3_9GLOM|nr:hypothetical protein RclHR1_00520040 [Rhizophagus clarus]
MIASVNCLILGEAPKNNFNVVVGEEYINDEKIVVDFDHLTVSNFKELLFRRGKVKMAVRDPDSMDLYKVELSLSRLKDKTYTIDEIENLGVMMESMFEFKEYFNNDDKKPKPRYLHIFIVPTIVASAAVFETVDEVLRKVDSHWERFKEKLVKKIELEEFRVSDHIYKDSINASGIPVIEGNPSFLLHSLPDSDNNEGYIPEDVLTNLIKKVMGQRWLFLMGTSGSGKTRSLYELLCRTYGIYFTLNTGNGSKNNNLGSRDMDVTINDLGFKLVPNKLQENSNIALRYTRAMLLGRLFILTKLLEFHRNNNFINFTPKQWLLMQLFPLQIYEKDDFWCYVARDFRNLDPERHNELVATFVTKFKSFVPKQARLPIAIDESQSAIEKYKNMFLPTNPNNQTRPFFVILLRMVLHLITAKLCLILSGTGMSFDDIKNFAPSSIAKSNGLSFEDFFFYIRWVLRK